MTQEKTMEILDKKLEKAESRGELRLHFQPRIDIESGRIVSAEALLRWEQDGSLVPPDNFIPIAEKTGLIRDIGAWVIEEACRNCRRWQEIGLKGLPVSVNVSAVQFRWGDLERIVADALRHSGLDPNLLEIEITESRTLEEEDTSGQITRIAATGVRVAIDDFGRGYSNLARIGQLDVQTHGARSRGRGRGNPGRCRPACHHRMLARPGLSLVEAAAAGGIRNLCARPDTDNGADGNVRRRLEGPPPQRLNCAGFSEDINPRWAAAAW